MKHDPRLAQYPLTREQSVFASVWYNMTYAYSLDSHRVRVMHAVNILEELMRLTTLPHASNEDRWMVAREAIGILESEAALKREALNAATTGIRTLLGKSFGEKFDKGAIEKGRALLESHLREYVDLLRRYYVDEVIQGLHDAVLAPDARPEPERFKEIRSLTGSLISCLIARGQSIEGLYQLYRQVLVPIKPQKKAYVFAQRFDLLKKLITSESRAWRACFAIDGVTDTRSFPPQIGDIVFNPEAPEEMGALPGMKEQGHRLFAYGWADAIDARTAGQLVHDRINRVLDLVRFEYDRANIVVSDQFAVPKPTGPDWRLLPIPKVVPNPQSSVSPEELDAFARNVGRLVTGERFSREGRDRVLAAFRLYRMGADTTSFENKLVNWWTGLEFLAKGMSGSGPIGDAVEDSVTPVLMGVSVINHLTAYREVLLEHSVELVDTPSGQPIALKELDCAQLYDVLAQPAHRRTVNDRLRDVPLTQMRFDQFIGFLASPGDMNTFLGRAEQGLRWHLQRIYRARCDIVHSAGRMVNIALLCANLEAYLKSALTALLAAFGRIPTLASPTEFFIRAEHSYANARETLGRGNTGALKAFLTELKPQQV
ncbi:MULTISPECIES: hypothetical protein [Burkholderia]|nr:MULTISPECIES: hypothetical protein [Burkholderia]EKS9794212.1 hypothetical protein [Burkholderia cepacia]EKS9802160.1 hypothetical protein [Burkholderia cepacia]EKS9810935.1 hypothetical protein [Burkholderia cepacia]EKS9816463.1 hypothetical protein [Burkholderia cepacia]EKS9825213.1 hypothetical protein [Burkholderia cepacia]